MIGSQECRLRVVFHSQPLPSTRVVRRCFFLPRHVEILIGLAFAGRHTAQFILHYRSAVHLNLVTRGDI
jgi:hypothetical protein